jgi:hypothetical protein
VILSNGGDGAPFTFDSVMGDFSGSVDRGAPGLAVYTIYTTIIIVFFFVFHPCYCVGFYRSV